MTLSDCLLAKSNLALAKTKQKNKGVEKCKEKRSPTTLIMEGDMGICSVAVLMFFYCGDAVNRISICGVSVILNPSVCDVCVFHVAVFGEMKSFATL